MKKPTLWQACLGCVLCFLCLLCFLAPAGAWAQAQQPDPLAAELRAKLARDLEQIAAGFDGAMGIAVKDLAGGETFGVNADSVFPQASSIKIPILIELYRQAQAGTLKLEERVELKRELMTGGSGVLQRFGEGTSALSLRDLAVLMIVLSDNTATNILIDRVGMANVNATLDRLGLARTRLQRRMMDAAAQRASRENLSTPREMTALLELLHAGKILDAAHTAAVLEILKYPKTTALRRGLPANVELANKPGGIAGVACDSGIVLLAGRAFAISVMTTYDKDTDAAERAISDVSRRVYDYFERLARSNSYGARLP
jgi:beta-lactamase class A